MITRCNQVPSGSRAEKSVRQCDHRPARELTFTFSGIDSRDYRLKEMGPVSLHSLL